jgi:hypothetical protein
MENIAASMKSDQCIRWLKYNGFIVKGIQKGIRRHRIFIENSDLCKTLEGAIYRYERLLKIERRYLFVLRFDCEVRWNVDGEI